MDRNKTCPFCGGKIPSEASVCMYCGGRLVEKHVPERVSVDDLEEAPAQVNDLPAEQRSSHTGKYVAGIVIAAGIAVGLYFLLRSGDDDYQRKVRDFLAYVELTEDDVMIQYEGVHPSVYYMDYEGFPARYDLDLEEAVQLRSFKCTNRDDEIYFDYRTDLYRYGNMLIISGYNGWNGAGAGNNVVAYNTYTDQARYICFGRTVRVYPPFVTTYNMSEGYGFHSVLTGDEAPMMTFAGDVGGYDVVMCLAGESGLFAGFYYYESQGPGKKIYLEGYYDGEQLHMKAYPSIVEDAEVSETMTLTVGESSMSGSWCNERTGQVLHMKVNNNN